MRRERGRADLVERVDDFIVRVTVRIVDSCVENREGRSDGLQEQRGRGEPAALMSNFEDVGAEGARALRTGARPTDQVEFLPGIDIASEQERGFSETGTDHDGCRIGVR